MLSSDIGILGDDDDFCWGCAKPTPREDDDG